MFREVVFWESLTGERFPLISERQSATSADSHGYLSVDCVFSATRFLANRQSTALALRDTSFFLEGPGVQSVD